MHASSKTCAFILEHLVKSVVKMEVIHVSKNPELRILKSKRFQQNINNNTQEVNSIKKCLFGLPDIQEVEELLHEQIKEDWERIKNRFGIDMEDIENMENERLQIHTPRKRKLESKTKNKSVKKRRLFQQLNPYDRKITDFYQERKAALVEKKEN